MEERRGGAEPPIDFERIRRLVSRVVREELARQRREAPEPEPLGPETEGE